MLTIQDLFKADLIARDKAVAVIEACIRVAEKSEKSYDPDLRRNRLSVIEAARGEVYEDIIVKLLRSCWNETFDLAKELGIPHSLGDA